MQDAFNVLTCKVKLYVAMLQNFQAFVYTNSNMVIMQTLDDYLQEIVIWVIRTYPVFLVSGNDADDEC